MTLKFGDAGEAKDYVFLHAPVGLDFEMKMPIRVKHVFHGGYGEFVGVKVGMTLRAVNGEDITKLVYAECFKKIMVAEKPLDKVPNMKLGFKKADGSAVSCHFYHRPLGFDFARQLPIVVSDVFSGSYAEIVGVQPGWIIQFINGASVEQDTDAKSTIAKLVAAQSGMGEVPQMALAFMLPDKSVKEVVFCKKPLGVDLKEDGGVVVKSVVSGSYGEASGVKAGWRVLNVDGVKVEHISDIANIKEAEKKLHAEDSMRLFWEQHKVRLVPVPEGAATAAATAALPSKAPASSGSSPPSKRALAPHVGAGGPRVAGAMSLMYFNAEPHDDSDDEAAAVKGITGRKTNTSASRYGMRDESQDVRVRQMIDWYFQVLAYLDGVGADFTPSSKATGKGKLPRSGAYSIIEGFFWGDKHDNPSELYGAWLERNFFRFIPQNVRRKHRLRNPFQDAQASSEGDVNWWDVAGLWEGVYESYGCNLYEGVGRSGGMRAFQTQNAHLIQSFQELLQRPPTNKTCPLWDATSVNLLDNTREEAEFYHVALAYEDVIRPWRPPSSIFQPRQLGTVDDLQRLLTKRAAANEKVRLAVDSKN